MAAPRTPGTLVPLAILVLGLGACATTRTDNPIGLDVYEVVHNEPLRAWRMVHAGTTLGYVVHFGDPDDPERVDVASYSVRNAYSQELGSIDGLGRAWRFVPHEDEAQWTGTGTLVDGARSILQCSPEATLEDVPLEAIGGAPPSRR